MERTDPSGLILLDNDDEGGGEGSGDSSGDGNAGPAEFGSGPSNQGAPLSNPPSATVPVDGQKSPYPSWMVPSQTSPEPSAVVHFPDGGSIVYSKLSDSKAAADSYNSSASNAGQVANSAKIAQNGITTTYTTFSIGLFVGVGFNVAITRVQDGKWLLGFNPGFRFGGSGGNLVTGYATSMNQAQTVQFLTGTGTTGNFNVTAGLSGGMTFGGANQPTIFEEGGGLTSGISVTIGFSTVID